MTSKEFILSEIDNLKDMLENSKKLKCETIIKCSEEEIKQYNQVLKDLEVLDILKKAYYLAIWDLYHYHKDKEYYLQDGSDGYREMEITKEQYDLIKQWVEEE